MTRLYSGKSTLRCEQTAIECRTDGSIKQSQFTIMTDPAGDSSGAQTEIKHRREYAAPVLPSPSSEYVPILRRALWIDAHVSRCWKLGL